MEIFVAKSFSRTRNPLHFHSALHKPLHETKQKFRPDCCTTTKRPADRDKFGSEFQKMEVSAQRSVLFTNRVPSLTSALRFLSLARLRTLDDLTANFATHVGGGVNVEIPAARHQVGRLVEPARRRVEHQ